MVAVVRPRLETGLEIKRAWASSASTGTRRVDGLDGTPAALETGTAALRSTYIVLKLYIKKLIYYY